MGTVSATSVTLTETDQWVPSPEGHGPSEPLLSTILRKFHENVNDRVLWIFNRMVKGLLGTFTTFAAGAVNTATDRINLPSHGIPDNTLVRYGNVGGTAMSATGMLAPSVGSLSISALYVRVVDADNIQLALTSGGAGIDLTAAGSGTHYLFTVPAALDLLVHPSFTTLAGATIPAGNLRATLAGYFLPLSGGTMTGDLTISGAGNIIDGLSSGNIPSIGNTTVTVTTFENFPTWRCVDQSANHTFTLPTPSKAGLTRMIVRNDFTSGFAALFVRASDASTIGRLPGTAASGSAGLILKSFDSGDGKGLQWHASALGNADQCT